MGVRISVIGVSYSYCSQPSRRHCSTRRPKKNSSTISTVTRSERQTGGPRREGTVNWYVAMNRVFANDLSMASKPDWSLKVDTLTGSGGSLLNRVLTESRARSHQFDVFNTRSMTVNTLKKAGAIMRYRSPYRAACATASPIRRAIWMASCHAVGVPVQY